MIEKNFDLDFAIEDAIYWRLSFRKSLLHLTNAMSVRFSTNSNTASNLEFRNRSLRRGDLRVFRATSILASRLWK
jgi:hypothetical protein